MVIIYSMVEHTWFLRCRQNLQPSFDPLNSYANFELSTFNAQLKVGFVATPSTPTGLQYDPGKITPDSGAFLGVTQGECAIALRCCGSLTKLLSTSRNIPVPRVRDENGQV